MLKLVILSLISVIPALVGAFLFGFSKQQTGMIIVMLFMLVYCIDGLFTWIRDALIEVRNEVTHIQRHFGIPPKSTKKEL